jgi:hypothetical protein
MKVCSEPTCPVLVRHGTPAEYRDDALVCRDCGTPLVDAQTTSPSASAAVSTGLRSSSGTGDRFPLGAVIVSALACGAFVAACAIPLPSIDASSFYVSSGQRQPFFPPRSLTLAALGFAPFFIASLIVEAVLVATPAWRRRREGDLHFRRRVLFPVLAIAAILGALSATAHAFTLADVGGAAGFGDALAIGEIRGTLLVGGFTGWVIAATASRFGVVNGFSLALASLAAVEFLSGVHDGWLEQREGAEVPIVPWIILLALLAVVARRGVAVPDDEDALPRPLTGLMPLAIATAVLGLPYTLAVWIINNDVLDLALTSDGPAHQVADALLVAALTAALLVWFFPRARTEAAMCALVGRAPSRAAWRSATVSTVLFILAVFVIETVAGHLPPTWFALDAFSLLVLMAVVRDLISEVRFRSLVGDVVVVWSIERLALVRPAIALLEAQGVIVHARSVHHRLLWQALAPWLTVELCVASADQARAHEILRARWPEI